jgi:fission process protein 1
MTNKNETEVAETQEVDIYRDTPVRLLGYANEVGEAFRALVHINWVRASYGVASVYVLADTRDKANKMMRRSDDATDATEKRKKVAAAAFDTLLWQVEHFLSIVYPVYILKREHWG